jgi:hypothetical protein
VTPIAPEFFVTPGVNPGGSVKAEGLGDGEW